MSGQRDQPGVAAVAGQRREKRGLAAADRAAQGDDQPAAGGGNFFAFD